MFAASCFYVINSLFSLNIMLVSAFLCLFEKYGLQFIKKSFACLFGSFDETFKVQFSA